LVYNAFYSAPSYFDQPSPFKTLYPQNTMNVLKNGFSFNQDDTPQEYNLGKGTYRIFHFQPYHPIMLLNKEKKSLIYLETLQSAFTVTGPGPDGESHLFYYGVFDLVVTGNFDTMFIYGLKMNQNEVHVVFRYRS